MRYPISVAVALLASSACSSAPSPESSAVPTWSYDASMRFPAGSSLARPEDGVAVRGGRLIVADQVHGLRAIEADGTSRPFGRFAEAGYVHEPPALIGGPNGVSLEPGGAHLLVADVFTGAIYRVELATEATELAYQHPWGVNAARRDRTGAIWFTQSTENAGEESVTRLFAAVDLAMADGALFRIPPATPDGPRPAAELVLDGLYFANGFAIDEEAGRLYLAETMRDRVFVFDLDTSTGKLSDRRVIAEVLTPDNLELDGAGRLWIVSPIRNEIVVVELATGQATSVFRAAGPENERLAAEWRRRGTTGEPRLELMAPDLWAPLPGLLTGLILSPDAGPVYLAGLGDALVRLER